MQYYYSTKYKDSFVYLLGYKHVAAFVPVSVSESKIRSDVKGSTQSNSLREPTSWNCSKYFNFGKNFLLRWKSIKYSNKISEEKKTQMLLKHFRLEISDTVYQLNKHTCKHFNKTKYNYFFVWHSSTSSPLQYKEWCFPHYIWQLVVYSCRYTYYIYIIC